MEKTIEEYIEELKAISKKSIFNNENNNATQSFPEAVYGNLLISVSHSQNTFPVENASYSVFDKNSNLMSVGKTDKSGKSPLIPLPALPKSITENPGTQLINSAVFYDVLIKAENYIPFTIKNIPLYEGVTTLQNFDLTFFGASPDGIPQTITLPTENTL